jgi:repressor of nif and glnA expression
MEKQNNEEIFRVAAGDLVKKVKEILEEGNARRISILNEKGEKIMEFPLTIGAVGLIIAPILAAVGALAAIATNCTLIVEKKNPEKD